MARRHCQSPVILAVMVALTCVAASAQVSSNTAAGVAAFQAGDYERAAAILGPIADRFPRHDDATAQFFMAQMYAAGLGVPMDLVRACVFYQRAGIDHTSPYRQKANELASLTWGALERDDGERCQLLVNLGFHHGFEPVTFDLGPGHWVSVDLARVSIQYEGRERRTASQFPTFSGAVFLPVEHTELILERPELQRRHFIQVAAWDPEPHGDTWHLRWKLFEVMRDEWIFVKATTLTTYSGTKPPQQVDLSEFARVRVECGDAELLLSTGSDRGKHHLESESERRARIERDRARIEQERTTDWKAVRDINRPPGLSYADGDGCAHVRLYGWSADRAEAIDLLADRDLLQLSTSPQIFNLAGRRTGLELTVHVYERSQRSLPSCTDAPLPAGPEHTWRAIAGTVTIELVDELLCAGRRSLRATARISGAEFLRSDGLRMRQPTPITLTATVGWVPG